jgi:hypothetical protein
MAPDDQELDLFMNRFEQWRDPGHVRHHTISEWRQWMQEAGLRVEHVEPLQTKRYEFAEWTERMRMPAAERDALEAWLIAAPPRCAEFFSDRSRGWACEIADRMVRHHRGAER